MSAADALTAAGVESLSMTPREWALVPGNPRQRDTEARVQKAKHLLTPVEDHRVVKMAVLPDGSRVKIDGHTRALFWQLHPERAPRSVLVVVFYVKDAAEALLLYDACDSQAALETATDKVFGAFRETEFKPVSGFMQMGRIAAALRFAYQVETHQPPREQSVHQLVRHWLPELQYLDGLGLNPAYFNTAVLAAALITLRRYRAMEGAGIFRHPDQDEKNSMTEVGSVNENGGRKYRGERGLVRGNQVREFWERYARNEGSKTNQAVDAIEALRRVVEQHRQQHQQKATILYTASRAVSCVERHLQKRGLQLTAAGNVKVQGADLSKYFPPAPPEKPPPE